MRNDCTFIFINIYLSSYRQKTLQARITNLFIHSPLEIINGSIHSSGFRSEIWIHVMNPFGATLLSFADI